MGDKRLLAIDDDPDFVDVVRSLAVDLGYDVMTTGNVDDFTDAVDGVLCHCLASLFSVVVSCLPSSYKPINGR